MTEANELPPTAAGPIVIPAPPDRPEEVGRPTPPIRHVYLWFRWRLKNFSVLLVLVLLGAWGHKHHWQFTSHQEHGSEGADGHLPTGVQESAAPQGDGAAADAAAQGGENAKPAGEAKAAPLRVVRFESDVARERAGIEVHQLRNRAVVESVVANGVVGYDQSQVAQLSAKVPGTVWRVEKLLGQPVSKGDVLALVDSSDVGNAKADFLSAVARLRHLETRLEMLRPLENVVAARQIRESEAAVREARIQLYNAHQTLINLGLSLDLAEAQRLEDETLRHRVHFLGIPAEMAEAFDPQTTTANLLPLVAPFDGVVIGRDVVLGEVALPTEPQFAVADCGHLWITLQVRLEDASEVCVGQKVLFHPDGTDHEVACNICWISPEMDEKTRTVEVRADAENPWLDGEAGGASGQRLLHVNSFGTGRITIDHKETALRIPNTALQYIDGVPVVFVESETNTFVCTPIELGTPLGESTEVLKGLSPGDRIVTTGSLLLKSELAQQTVALVTHAEPAATASP